MRDNADTLKAFGLALAVHAAVLGAFTFSLSLPSRVQQVPPQETDQPIQAFAVDTAAVQAEVERQQAKEAAARAAEQQRQRELAEQERKAREARAREEQRLQEIARQREEAKRQQEAEQARLAKLKEEQAREAERLKKLQEQRAAEEAKRKAEEQARLERERKAREEAERKRQEEEKRKAEEAKRKAAEEAKRRAEEERRKAEEAKRRQAEEEARRAQIAAEELNNKIRQAVPGWANAVTAHVRRYWTLPPGSYAGRETTVEIRLALNGNVLSVRTVRSSGDATFDRLAEATIQKASPLPMPADADVARAFSSQGVQFIFKPSQ